jgi:RNA polymerase sigma-70 factor (sigma-E family)
MTPSLGVFLLVNPIRGWEMQGTKAVATKRGNTTMADLYSAFAPGAARLAYLLTGDTHLAEDLVQEAFLRMLGRFENLRKPASFQAYLHRTIVNLSRKHWRRRELESRYAGREQTLKEHVDAPDVETTDEMWAAVQALPYRQRAAIVLRFYEDLSEHQTAELLDCSPKAVRSLVGRAKDSLRTMRLEAQS